MGHRFIYLSMSFVALWFATATAQEPHRMSGMDERDLSHVA